MAPHILAASGIYAIVNRLNGKRYIGSAASLRNRWKSHRSALNRGVHHSKKLQSSWQKNGHANFEFTVIEFVGLESLIEREQFWIDHYDAAGPNGYNICQIAGRCIGLKQTDNTKAKRSAALSGRARPEEVKRQISLTKRGKPAHERALIAGKVSQALRSRTPEEKAESAARAVETKRANGTLKSKPEAIAKQRAAITGRKLSPEAIAKRSATVRANAAKRRDAGETRQYVRRK
jgi:group I intron endonuclease